MRRLAVAAAVLSGCAQLVPIDYSTPPPADWPKLEQKVAYVDQVDIPRFCRGLGVDAGKVQSCAVTSFRYGVCYVYLSTKDPALLKHELAHCRGYGHVGNAKAPAQAWERWKAQHPLNARS